MDAWTLRDLVAAADGRRKNDWDHTAALVATLIWLKRDPKKRGTHIDPRPFHPYRSTEPTQDTRPSYTPSLLEAQWEAHYGQPFPGKSGDALASTPVAHEEGAAP